MRGDEPFDVIIIGTILHVFPACAGMNLCVGFVSGSMSRVPRMRGDEPAQGENADQAEVCSPHARG